MIVETVSVLGGIKTAMDMAKGIAALKSETEINQAIINIQQALLDVQAAAFSDKEVIARLNGEVSALEKQIQDSTDWEIVKARYVLTISKIGAYTYDLKPDLVSEEIFHRLCTKCFEDGTKSILHTRAKHSGGEIVVCPKCQFELILSDFEQTIQTVPRRSRHDELSGF